MSDGDRARLGHMLDAARMVVKLVHGKSRQAVQRDEVLMLALVHLLEVLGEAAKAVSGEVRRQAPTIPWRDLAGTRDRLIHGYFDVDLDIVWQIVTRDLPPLIEALERLVTERKDG